MKNIIQNFKEGCKLIFNPKVNINSSGKLSVKESLTYVFRFIPLPVLFIIIVGIFDLLLANAGLVTSTFWNASLDSPTAPGNSGSWVTIFFALGTLLVFILSTFVTAGIVHLIAKFILRIWKGSYARTFTAMMYGLLPIILFFWVMNLPLFYPIRIIINIVFTAMYLWAAFVTVICLSNQHEVSIWKALIGYVIGMIVVFFVIIASFFNFAITVGIWKETFNILN
jgi:hypothetical protein